MKNLSLIIGLAASLSFALSGCLGSGLPPTITATVESSIGSTPANTCQGMTSGSTCVLVINYNQNNNSGLTLSYTPYPFPQIYTLGDFESNFTYCKNNMTESGQCRITITYSHVGPSNNTNINANLVFSLGTAVSNIILISGN